MAQSRTQPPRALVSVRFPDRLSPRETGVEVKVVELIRLLERDGWRLVRTKGSHRQFQHPTRPGTVTVAGKPSVDIPPGTLSSILRQSGLKKRGAEE
jgi:predicted RNA binding protein YcfA (HicA-like mRNA interferase family)